MHYPNFCGSSYSEISLAAAGDRSVNLFVHVLEKANPKSPIILVGSPGKRRFATLPDIPVRCIWAGEGRCFVVGGATLYELFENGTFSVVGDVGRGATPAQIFSNGVQLFIVSNQMGYLADGVTVTPVVPATTGTFIDGYFFAQQPGTKNFQISALYDGTSWDPLDYAVKEGDAYALKSIFAYRKMLCLMGSESYEVWQDTGNPDFPFQLIQGSYTQTGIEAPFSIAQSDKFRYFLGSSERGPVIVWQEAGWGSPIRISNHAVETAIQGYLRGGQIVSDAVGVCKQHGGHAWYELHFPTADATWVYDETSSAQLGHPQWHERASWDTIHAEWHADIGRSHAYIKAWGKHLVGDFRNGNIYEESFDCYDDAGVELRAMRSAPWIGSEQQRSTFSQFILDMQVGGYSNLLFDDPNPRIFPTPRLQRLPQACLQISDDGGFTWGDEIWVGAGMTGEYKARAIWNRLGMSWNRCFRVIVSDPIQRCFVDAYLTVNGK